MSMSSAAIVLLPIFLVLTLVTGYKRWSGGKAWSGFVHLFWLLSVGAGLVVMAVPALLLMFTLIGMSITYLVINGPLLTTQASP